MHRAIVTGLAAACLSAAIAAPASAAPHAVRVPPPPPPAPPTWTGFYVGGLAGGAWGNFNATTSTFEVPGGEFAPPAIAAFNAAGVQSIKPSAFIGGFDAGYNWQTGIYLLGVEADIEWLHFGGTAGSGVLAIPGSPGQTFSIVATASIDWLATARGRLGLVFGDWLFYGTGGAAFTKVNGNFAFSETISGTTETAAISGSKTGYTVGGGVEGRLWQHWTAKVEYLFVDFGSLTTTGSDNAFFFPQPFTHTLNLKLNIARAGLNYHF
jgi:outer membrane immunogenic protein